MANSLDPDQMPHSTASDLDLHRCKGLSVPLLRVIMVLVIKFEQVCWYLTSYSAEWVERVLVGPDQMSQYARAHFTHLIGKPPKE